MHHSPALTRFPNEAAIIGRMVVGFGELEYMVCNVAGIALNDRALILKTLYRLRSTSARIDTADTLMQPAFHSAKMANEQCKALAAVRYCLGIRNQYAHCNWADNAWDNKPAGLFFADLQNSAGRKDWFHDFRHVDVPLLEAQETYFAHARNWLFYLEHELAVTRVTARFNPIPIPADCTAPHLYNPPNEHVPPWLSDDDKARHIARALEAAAQPIREPSVPKLSPEERAAKVAKEAREGKHSAE